MAPVFLMVLAVSMMVFGTVGMLSDIHGSRFLLALGAIGTAGIGALMFVLSIFAMLSPIA